MKRVKIAEEKAEYNYSHLLLLFETYAKMKRKLAKKNKQTLRDERPWYERMWDCCDVEDEEEVLGEVDQKLIQDEIKGDEDRGRFRVDQYMPEEYEDDVWNFVMGDQGLQILLGDNRKKIMTANDEAVNNLENLSEAEYNDNDLMTNVLAKLKVNVVNQRDRDFWNTYNQYRNFLILTRKEHLRLMRYDQEEIEKFYQHIYDYFCGRTGMFGVDAPSKGMIFNNFVHFLRLAQIKGRVSQAVYEPSFAKNSRKTSNTKSRFLEYGGFINMIYDMAKAMYPEKSIEKLLKKFTKEIYPPIMINILDISSIYDEHRGRYIPREIVYPPQLGIFFGQKYQIKNDNDQPAALFIPNLRSDDFNLQMQKTANELREEEQRNAYMNDMVAPGLGAKSRASRSLFPMFLGSNKNMLSPKASTFGASVESPSNKKKKEKNSCKKCLKSCFMSCKNCRQSCFKCTKYTCWTLPTRCGEWLEKKTRNLGIALGFEVDEEEDNFDYASKRVRRLAPTWPVTIDVMMKNIPIAEETYFKKEAHKGLTLKFNITNISAVVGKISEFYGYMSFAFRKEVNWFGESKWSDTIMVINGESSYFDQFSLLFWIAFSLVCVYTIAAIPAIRSLRKGKLGEDESGKEAKFPHPQFFLAFTVTTIGQSLFTQIMKWILDGFVCNYDVEPWVLARDTTIECLSDEHFGYMGVGITALVLYYPICTFMYPNFQFRNKVLDLKYTPSWCVLIIQAKLLLTGFVSFFKATSETDSTAIYIQLLGTASVLSFLAIANTYTKPCLVKKFNMWDTAGYSISALTNIVGVIVYRYEIQAYGLIIVGGGLIIIIAITLIARRIIYGQHARRVKAHAIIGDVAYDDNKLKAENVDLEAMRKAVRDQEEAIRKRQEDLENEEYEANYRREYGSNKEQYKF